MGGASRLVQYLAVPPPAFAPLTRALARHSLTAGARVVYEKPYGTSPETFRASTSWCSRRQQVGF